MEIPEENPTVFQTGHPVVNIPMKSSCYIRHGKENSWFSPGFRRPVGIFPWNFMEIFSWGTIRIFITGYLSAGFPLDFPGFSPLREEYSHENSPRRVAILEKCTGFFSRDIL